VNLETRLGPVALRTPLIAASGTVGAVDDWVKVGAPEAFGAAVAKSVSADPWPGRPPPRLAPVGAGMLNGIGIQNPGIEAWTAEHSARLGNLGVPVWGSAVGRSPEEYGIVAKGLAEAGLQAIEVNLSCPNLEDGRMFALDAVATARVVSATRSAVEIPLGAKLSPNAEDIADVARAAVDSGADWLVLTNTVWGAAIDLETRLPVLSGGIGGYSGPPLKPIALRCVLEVRSALPAVPIAGCGGVTTGGDVVEYLMAGANAVAVGTANLAEPAAGRRILAELEGWCHRHAVSRVGDLVGSVQV
jgi:dihydroorotate dehydrogenase (NAD+) catalytic subunit